MSQLRKIILVEDDEFDADLIRRNLKKIPLANEVIHLETGKEFLDYLEKEGVEDISVVILDLHMPQITGIEALKAIREKEYAYFPIVVLTSSNQEPDIEKCYELGVNSFVTKPVKQAEFQQAISTLGLYWGILNELP